MDKTHQISVQALILFSVRFCVVTFGKIFSSDFIKNAKCVCGVGAVFFVFFYSPSTDISLSPVLLFLCSSQIP